MQADAFAQDLEAERLQREDATAAVMKLQEVIVGVKGEMDEAASAAGSARDQLEDERKARQNAEDSVVSLRSQLEEMQSSAEERSAEAQKAMQVFREEMKGMKQRSNQAMTDAKKKQENIEKVTI